MSLTWSPHVTVAAIVMRGEEFLMVEEAVQGQHLLNQPAGHWEYGETLIEAMLRETLEETAYTVAPVALVGIYTWQPADTSRTYVRFAFSAEMVSHDPQASLDEGIERALWLTADALAAQQGRHRSPLVMRCVQDYLSGQCYPLDLLRHL